jgi:outer membrane lipoprotein carrier protein
MTMTLRSWARTITLTAACIGWLATGTPSVAQSPLRSAEDLQQALQQRYSLVLDLSADFTQTYEGGVLRSSLLERGHMQVKIPGKMRWDYQEPEQKVMVSDGAQMFVYLPEDEQVLVAAMPAGDHATTPALLLAGVGDFVNDFAAALDTVQDAPPDSYVLRLTPTRPEPDFEFLTLVLDPRSLAITRLIAYDLQGGVSTFSFSNLQENRYLSDTPFTFEIPRGTEIIHFNESAPLQ